ncbi:MAG: TIGR02449 family protein [gamma proteobacterium symbiont of Bathyaustriella thionipta]|nr:TIGR02449 family protein [gamma proteobacterium symbiont of Bathyaustriella thionipta]MCU7948461.1 TIGR02449 family protein [gamma proteobacterium symbiont of Bathyaustriella thionipta]MCU7952457.1 TIGR02449 family protein [gamma proteobacterium symbiont of Bathyaustriella thionipta]MCU7955383.1 TIGR02449 family protein [gamma proteobacterium symbiont of Bathyaustriella thionipta]MCU7966211.1 TIGR02449 family protein [gamma proteobacterium symbiont of Bathyaustriella thionipta]
MVDNAIVADTDIELKRLDESVNILLDTISQLKEENVQLRSQQEFLQVERSRLMEKTETARTRVEAIINRLKAMESNG